MFDSGAAINVNRAPRIFRKVFEKRIPSRRPWLTVGLSYKCLQSLFGGRIKTVHRLVLHQLRDDRLDIGANGDPLCKTCWVPDPRNRETEQDHNDADYDHDLEECEARLIRSFHHL